MLMERSLQLGLSDTARPLLCATRIRKAEVGKMVRRVKETMQKHIPIRQSGSVFQIAFGDMFRECTLTRLPMKVSRPSSKSFQNLCLLNLGLTQA